MPPRRVDIQDFMVVCPSAASFAEALDRTAEVYRAAGRLLADRGLIQGVADEGGYWPAFDTNEEALELLVRAIEKAGFVPGDEVAISLDVAASQFGSDGRYRLALRRPRPRFRRADRAARALDRSLSDRLDRGPARPRTISTAFAASRRAYGSRVQVIGDDFLVTNAAKVRDAAPRRACTAVLIKPNQAGTITETKAALDAAKAAGLAHHRLRPLGRDRGRDHRPSRRRLGRRPAQGRLVHALRAHGEMERGAAHRGGARLGRPPGAPVLGMSFAYGRASARE